MSHKRTEEGVQELASRGHGPGEGHSAAERSPTRHFEDAYLNYMNANQALYEEFQKRSEEAYSKYVRALQEAWTHSDAQQRSVKAYEDYWRSVKNAWDSSDFQGRLNEAYRDYVGALKVGWASIDARTLDAHSLGTVGYSIVAACWHASRIVQVPIEKQSSRG